MNYTGEELVTDTDILVLSMPPLDPQVFFDALSNPLRRRLLAMLLNTVERRVCVCTGP